MLVPDAPRGPARYNEGVPAPLTPTTFKARTIMPGADVDQLETVEAGWLAQTLTDTWDWILARLGKRYNRAAIDGSPPPIAVRWLAVIVTRLAYAKRGFNPTSEEDKESIIGAAVEAKAEIKEAADSKEGLFELPLASAPNASAVSRGGPLGYSEQSPYVWQDAQVAAARNEDQNGSGS